MKFTCDSCGAQYMIGDDKLGKRGVKVRCKKCSYVIIVRPPGYAPQDKRTATRVIDRDQEVQTDLALDADPPSSAAPASSAFENDMDEPLTRVLGDRGAERREDDGFAISDDAMSDESRAFSGSDEDLSQEQTSLMHTAREAPTHGAFSDEDATISAHASISDDAQPQLEVSSSFMPQAPSLLNIDNIPKIRIDDESDGDERTSVDSLSINQYARSAPILDPASSEDDEPYGANLGRGDPPAEGFEEDSNRHAAEARTRRINHDAARGDVRDPLSFDDSVVSAKISALDKSELDDMQSSLNDSLASDSWGARVGSAVEPVTDARVSAVGSNNMAALSRLAASQDEAPAPPMVQGYASSGAAVAASLARLGIAQDAPVPEIEAPLDFELKNAFDQMFGAAADEAEIDAGFGGALEAAPNEVFRSTYNEGNDRKPTRVFDLDAMKQVQSEQDLAHKEPNGHAAAMPAGAGGAEAHEWYVAINDEQVGPMSFADFRSHWEKRDTGPSSLCWRVGMPDWTSIREVEELAILGDMAEPSPDSTSRQDAPREDTDEAVAMMPHAIAMPEEAPRSTSASSVRSKSAPERADVRSANTRGADMEEPSWRPSAASALASLAAQELGGIEDKPQRDADAGRALPAASDALEKLLSGAGAGGDRATSPFGAAEMSSSKIRPLPKAPDIASSASLRDPVSSRPRSNLIPVAIIGGFLFLGVVIAALVLRSPSSPPVPVVADRVEAVKKEPANAEPAKTEPAKPEGAAETAPPPGDPSAPPPNGAGTPTPQNGAGTPTPPNGAGTPPPSGTAEATPPTGGEAAALAVTEAGGQTEPKTGDKKRPGTKVSREAREERTAREDSAREARAQAERDRKREPENDGMAVSSDDDLLGGPKRQKRIVQEEAPSNDLPKQLEDSDILGELRRNKAAIQACRTKQASADPALEGTLTVNFVIEGSGRTKHWEVEPAKFKSSVVGKCVVEAVKKWSFPRFSGRPMPVDFPVRVGGS